MKAEEAIGASRTYVNQTVIGMGAIKGAPCKIKSTNKAAGITTIVFEWKDNLDVTHESTIQIADGADGQDGAAGAQGPEGPQGPAGPAGEDGDDGFSPTITVKSSTSTEYILTITDKNGSYDTPNLKGSGGGGGASALADLTDVELSSLASGDALVFNSSKWSNVSLATVATSGEASDINYDNSTNGLAATDAQAAIDELADKKVDSIAVNGVAQTIAQGAVDLDIASNLISETQWTSIESLLS